MSGMYWSYRATVETIDGEEEWAIREVYFDKGGGIVAWTKEPVAAVGDTKEELLLVLARMLADVNGAEPVRIDAGEAGE